MASRTVQVELHAQAADLAGLRTVDVPVDPGATAADVKRALADHHPSLRDLLGISALATDREYLRDGAPIDGAASFHLVPPVSGG